MVSNDSQLTTNTFCSADITIMNGDMLKKISIAVRLKKKDLRPADKSPRAYNRQPFTLDGRMDLEIAFGERAMTTPVYIKMKAHDPRLLSVDHVPSF